MFGTYPLALSGHCCGRFDLRKYTEVMGLGNSSSGSLLADLGANHWFWMDFFKNGH